MGSKANIGFGASQLLRTHSQKKAIHTRACIYFYPRDRRSWRIPTSASTRKLTSEGWEGEEEEEKMMENKSDIARR